MLPISTLTVVIPAYNEELRIGKCLDSILAQRRPPDEIIVVDNASTDSTASVVDDYAERTPTLRRIEEFRPGVAAARECGFDAATSDIIARVDADCIAEPDWVARIVDVFDRHDDHDCAAATGPVIVSDGPFTEREMRRARAAGADPHSGKAFVGMAGPNLSIRSTAWRKIRDDLLSGDDADGTWEDIDIAIALRRAGLGIRFEPGIIVGASGRQARHSPWANRDHILGGIRTARARGDRAALRGMYAQLPIRLLTSTISWLILRPWDPEKLNWRPHRLLTPLPRERILSTEKRDASRYPGQHGH